MQDSVSGPWRTVGLANVRILSAWFVCAAEPSLKMYVHSTIRPSAFIGDNHLGPTGCAECVSLNQCLGMCGWRVIIKNTQRTNKCADTFRACVNNNKQ